MRKPESPGSGVLSATENIQLPPVWNARRGWLLLQLAANGFALAGAAIATSLLVRLVFDRLVRGRQKFGGMSTLWLAAGLALVALLPPLLRWQERVIAEKLGQHYVHELRQRLYAHLLRRAPRALQQRSHGALLLRFVGDLTALRQWISAGLARLLVAGISTAGVLLALAWLSPKLALVVGAILLCGVLSSWRAGARLKQTTAEARRHRARIAARVGETASALAVVQSCGQTRGERKRLARQSRRLSRALIARARAAGRLRACTELAAAASTVAVLLLGAHETAAGRITPGTVAAALAIIHQLTPPLRELGWVQEYWHNSRVALDKLETFLRLPTLLRVTPQAPPLRVTAGRLEFDHVTVPGVLNAISAVAEAGRITAIVGPNGAGKSTLLALAARLFDPGAGVVRLDGQDLAQHSLASVRRAIGVAGPDFPLLRGTVGQNLLYRCPDISAAEYERVAELCGIPALLAELPGGGAYRVSEGGRNLSAGQRQRIALARALLGNPPVLLLDEVDANLDAQAAALVDRVLAEYRGTVLLVTHRPERLVRAAAVWRLAGGSLSVSAPLPADAATGHLKLLNCA